MGKPRVFPLTVLILLTLLIPLAMPSVAWAEGEAPPVEAPPVGEGTDEVVPVVTEILEAAPPGTEVVVVDSTGTPEPLATAQAAERYCQMLWIASSKVAILVGRSTGIRASVVSG